MSINELHEQLKTELGRERFQHSINVSRIAAEMADFYHISVKKAEVLGLIHDCAKDYSAIDMKKYLKKYQIKLSEIDRRIPCLWHAYIGAEIARERYGINDQEMLSAIRYHTTGFPSFDTLGKILFIADKIEIGRPEIWLKEVREMIWKDLDQSMLVILNQNIKYLIKKGSLIHPLTIKTRNSILYDRKKDFDQNE